MLDVQKMLEAKTTLEELKVEEQKLLSDLQADEEKESAEFIESVIKAIDLTVNALDVAIDSTSEADDTNILD